jgi:hypothetical protein|tara:strand:+ start:67 stop:606 length:540 start_codon:yes stop_codon:yes gene_type:complete
MIKMLDFQEWKILKEIHLVSMNSHQQEIIIGVIGYLRKVKQDYHLQEDTEENEFLRLLNYPKQELFPKDEIDEIILTAVQDQFPKSFVRNTQISFDSDLEKIKIITQVPKQTARLEVRPNFTQVDLSTLVGQNLNFFMKDIHIYQHFTQDSIKGKYFTGVCDFDKQDEVYGKLDQVEFL